MRLRVGYQHSQFWTILGCFVHYYSLFWGPGVISTINDPRGAFMCRSSTLAILVDCGPFPGVLLTVLVSLGDFQFWSILARFVDYYSPFWGPGVISTINEPRGAFTCRSSALAVLADSGPFRDRKSVG